MVLITIITGVYKPTFTSLGGAPPCRHLHNLNMLLRDFKPDNVVSREERRNGGTVLKTWFFRDGATAGIHRVTGWW